jgi:hypothetical protein
MASVHALRHRFVTEDTVYGTILYSALIATVSTDGDDALDVLVISALSLIVFWAAHIYAGTIASHGVKDGEEVSLRSAFANSVRRSNGMLYAAILPSIVLLLGVVHVVSYEHSVDYSLWVNIVLLAVLGYLAFAERRARIIIRILGALGSAFFGLLMIVLNTAVH